MPTRDQDFDGSIWAKWIKKDPEIESERAEKWFHRRKLNIADCIETVIIRIIEFIKDVFKIKEKKDE